MLLINILPFGGIGIWRPSRKRRKRMSGVGGVGAGGGAGSAGGVTHSGGGSAAACLLYTSPSPRDVEESRMPSSA